MARYWHRICPTCKQGRLFVKKRLDGGPLFLACEECFCAFSTPAKAADGNNCQEGMKITGAFASQKEIVEGGWSQFPFKEVS